MSGHICEVCGKTFEKVDCSACQYRTGQCTGIVDEITMCQECCAEDFAYMTSSNPIANVLSESV